MKVARPPEPKQYRCSGNGNGGKGCGAILEVEHSDLRLFTSSDYSGEANDPCVCFRCCVCGTITDIPRSDHPQHHTLKRFSMLWKGTGKDPEPIDGR